MKRLFATMALAAAVLLAVAYALRTELAMRGVVADELL